MGVYIKGMEMPTSCEECALNYDSYACIKTGSSFFRETEFDPFKGRLEDCPLVPIPPHGRLIDADKLQKSLEYVAGLDWNISVGASKGLDAATCMVEDAPTIIPAEEGE